MTLDILIPIYNPGPSWASELVVQAHALIERLPDHMECRLIMVNDGSPQSLKEDFSILKAKFPDAILVEYDLNRGKGYALRQAAQRSTADLIMYTDHDFPYTYGSMTRMIDRLVQTNAEAVVGKRDESYYGHISPRRRHISQILKKINRMVFSLPTDDTQCGLKAFKASVKEVFLNTKTDRYLIDVEFLKKLSRQDIEISIEPVKLREGVVLSNISNLSLIKEGLNYLRIMFFA